MRRGYFRDEAVQAHPVLLQETVDCRYQRVQPRPSKQPADWSCQADVLQQSDAGVSADQPSTVRLDQMPGCVKLVFRNAGHVRGCFRNLEREKRQLFISIDPRDEPRRRSAELTSPREQQKRT